MDIHVELSMGHGRFDPGIKDLKMRRLRIWFEIGLNKLGIILLEV